MPSLPHRCAGGRPHAWGRGLKLSDRIHKCPNCGLVMDRDENAARNVLMRALQRISTPREVIVGTRREGSTSTAGHSASPQAVPLNCAD
jgi:transposase